MYYVQYKYSQIDPSLRNQSFFPISYYDFRKKSPVYE